MNEPTHAELITTFDYIDGNLYWKIAKGSRAKIGGLAGSINHAGYRQIQIDGKLYYAHRLIFFYHHGYLPEQLDHIDGDKLNNDIYNLRKATNQENHFNERKTKSCCGKPTSSRFKGVSWSKHYKKWQSHIMIDGKTKNLGRYDSEVESAEAYNEAAIESFGEYAYLNIIDSAPGNPRFDSWGAHTL